MSSLAWPRCRTSQTFRNQRENAVTSRSFMVTNNSKALTRRVRLSCQTPGGGALQIAAALSFDQRVKLLNRCAMRSDNGSSSSVRKAAARLFRAYERHCSDSDEDALFAFLNALVSFGDKLNTLGRPNLNPSLNYQALRELRNLYHHEAELLHATRTVPVAAVPSLTTDLLLLCLVPRESADRAIERAKRESDQEAIRTTLHWYGNVVNIEPAIFNVMVDVFELLAGKNIAVDDECFALFGESYDFEAANGHSHKVTGQIYVRLGEVRTVLEALLVAAPQTTARPL